MIALARSLASRLRNELEKRILGLSTEEIRYTIADVRAEIRATRAELLAEIARLRSELEALTRPASGDEDLAAGATPGENPTAEA